ncbi:hypothetical protein P170DRAFT_177337 [Aspergillus steynii IBT 23096]|uniref:Uncharacterized protein n=1 Tax=Aspergillus steynii IBT 23096 TaxID=1392250 RepID=A0A2I2G8M6_9EURO|nr:uncharacterized protein P170DRAFT_177337 [Aspergillus steynii IBT 23096]PLB49193.1 hypothetical protein P170DRAFT_177337 [Aspergillus steynii IBT 23096]
MELISGCPFLTTFERLHKKAPMTNVRIDPAEEHQLLCLFNRHSQSSPAQNASWILSIQQTSASQSFSLSASSRYDRSQHCLPNAFYTDFCHTLPPWMLDKGSSREQRVLKLGLSHPMSDFAFREYIHSMNLYSFPTFIQNFSVIGECLFSRCRSGFAPMFTLPVRRRARYTAFFSATANQSFLSPASKYQVVGMTC